MSLREFRIRLGLIATRRQISSGNYAQGFRKAYSLFRKFPQDARVVTLLADACLFSGNHTEASDRYNQAKSLLDGDTSPSKNDCRFLRAYISCRMLEVKFIQYNQKGVAKAGVVEELNRIPAGSSVKALFFIDKDCQSIPRLYGSRNAQKNVVS